MTERNLLGIKRMFARVQTNAALARDQANVLLVRSILSFFFGVLLRAHPGAFYPGVYLSPGSHSRTLQFFLPLLIAPSYGVVGWRRWEFTS